MDKVERDGKVAVIVSYGYGAGWSTWAVEPEAALFAPDVVAWIEAGRPDDPEVIEAFGEKYGPAGGLHQASIEWLPKGTQFMVDEYDGAESLTIIEPTTGYIA